MIVLLKFWKNWATRAGGQMIGETIGSRRITAACSRGSYSANKLLDSKRVYAFGYRKAQTSPENVGLRERDPWIQDSLVEEDS